MSFMPAAEMQRTIQRLKALLAMIMPNSNSLNSLLLPDARCNDDTMGTLATFCAKVVFTFFFAGGMALAPDMKFWRAQDRHVSRRCRYRYRWSGYRRAPRS